MAITPIHYKIYFTPKLTATTYADEIEVSAKIIDSGVSSMRKSIDAGDYDIGIFYYGDVTLKAINKDGYLSQIHDHRSIFTYSRDLTKVRIEYNDKNGAVDVFKGLINEEGTRENFENEELTFRVLSFDSVIRTARIPAGTINNGTVAKTALEQILNKADITTVLTFDASKINPSNDIIIDDGSKFDNISTRDGLAKLLIATNSVFIIDSTDTMEIKSRDVTSGASLELFGPYSQRGRQNILKINKFNDGKQRLFTVVKVGQQASVETNYVEDYGYKQKTVSLDFITTESTQLSIASKLSNEFKFPKIELEVEVETSLVRNSKLLDQVLIDYPLRLKPYIKFYPVVGDATIDDAVTPLPHAFGSSFIERNIAFKIIEIKENAKRFTTILKLRQIGNDIGDGFIDISGASSLVGFAVIGTSKVA